LVLLANSSKPNEAFASLNHPTPGVSRTNR
jgi:hypothetical protein